MSSRNKMIYIFLGFILVWYLGSVLAIKYLGVSAFDTLGLGTVGGVFVAAFKDAWQFIWRKSSPQEEADAKKAGS
jgi:mannose/fructose/N-acetylgalactosamine-specific phosphotransferase system component IIC